MKLTQNTILITGGSTGIGFEFAKRLIEAGNTVIATCLDQNKLDHAKTLLPGLHTIQSDVADPKAIGHLFERVTKEFPELNILINNAGIMRTINLRDDSGDLPSLTQEIETNLKGPIRMASQFLRFFKNKPTAAIINVSSGLAFTPMPLCPIYSATKAGLHSFTLSLRVQLKNTSVKVFELAPPLTSTEMLQNFDKSQMGLAKIMKVDEMVEVALRGIENNIWEIRPGQSNQFHFMSRLLPKLILKKMSLSVEAVLDGPK